MPMRRRLKYTEWGTERASTEKERRGICFNRGIHTLKVYTDYNEAECVKALNNVSLEDDVFNLS